MIGITGGAMKKLEASSLTETHPFDEAVDGLLKG
jgi:hypothetical protein